TERDLLEEVVSTVREMSHALIRKDTFDATAVSNQLDVQIERLDQMEYRYGPDHMQLGKALELLRTARNAIGGYLTLNAEKSDNGAA
ncbi:MAG: hypothetical protein KDE64_14330, partial [Rhodocyclaceae bacterium]|nr:hypothetical protein [Rhodocyclaceae bacterium]